MERRDFCRLIGVGCAIGCAGGLAGCARALEWSQAQHAREGAQQRMAPPRAETPTAAPAEQSTATAVESEPPAPQRFPDLAVFTGTDPGDNVAAALTALGGMERFVGRGDRVLVKPNVLTARAPEYAATTNPQVVGALVRLAYEAGAAEVVVLDNPTAPPRQAFEVSGIGDAARTAGATVKVLTARNFERVRIPEGRVLTSWPLVTDVFESDVVINVPIAKTHGLAGLTMAMKNLMGIMGGTRGLVHQDFHQKIVDLNTLVRPHLVVLDAWRQLMANGPSGGSLADVRESRTVVVGTNQASVDAFGATLFGMQPSDLEYLRLAAEQGLGQTDLSALTIRKGTS